MIMKKIITSVIALLALTGAMFAQTGERLILEKGKTYTFCVRGEELSLIHIFCMGIPLFYPSNVKLLKN